MPRKSVFTNVVEAVARPFRHEAEARQLGFQVTLDPSLDRTMLTDSKRLQQVLKNLLSNAFKFTAQGEVTVRKLPNRGLERQSSRS